MAHRAQTAARNNAEWCAAVWRSHELPVERSHGMWFCPRATPQYYPNAVTVDINAEPASRLRTSLRLRGKSAPASA